MSRNRAEAQELFQRAFKLWKQRIFDRKDLEAALEAARCCRDGLGVEKDVAEAERWFAFAARRGVSEAEKELQELLAAKRDGSLLRRIFRGR